jgi:hypothetical protein
MDNIVSCFHAVPKLPLCLGVLKHRALLARGPIFEFVNRYMSDSQKVKRKRIIYNILHRKQKIEQHNAS